MKKSSLFITPSQTQVSTWVDSYSTFGAAVSISVGDCWFAIQVALDKGCAGFTEKRIGRHGKANIERYDVCPRTAKRLVEAVDSDRDNVSKGLVQESIWKLAVAACISIYTGGRGDHLKDSGDQGSDDSNVFEGASTRWDRIDDSKDPYDSIEVSLFGAFKGQDGLLKDDPLDTLVAAIRGNKVARGTEIWTLYSNWISKHPKNAKEIEALVGTSVSRDAAFGKEVLGPVAKRIPELEKVLGFKIRD